MNPEHEARIAALQALPVTVREALWNLFVPGWAYWLDGSECPECEGTIHEQEEGAPVDWCLCGGSWPCTKPRCETCGGTGQGPLEWTTDGLGRPGGTAAYVHRQDPEAVLFCPYSPTDILGLAAKLAHDDTGNYNQWWIPDSGYGCTVREHDGEDPRQWEPRETKLAGWTQVGPVTFHCDPLLAALDVLGQIKED